MKIETPGACDHDIDWSLCTWEGARLAQLRAYRGLSLAEKLGAIEEMCEVIRTLRAARERKGLAVENLSRTGATSRTCATCNEVHKG